MSKLIQHEKIIMIFGVFFAVLFQGIDIFEPISVFDKAGDSDEVAFGHTWETFLGSGEVK